jgi:predicted DNA-binding protein
MAKTFNFTIPDSLKERLEAESARTGASLAELTRRALERYLDQQVHEREYHALSRPHIDQPSRV